jgi:polysaccharide export outer membrane protein
MTHRSFARIGQACGLATLVVVLGLGMRPAAAQAQQPSTGNPGAASAAAQYRLGAGDVLRINVYQSPDLSVETRVNEAGTISYPLLGRVQLGGLSIPDAEKRIADGLRTGNFVRQPQVSILVTQVRGHQVSVLGQVGRPGRYPLEFGEVRLTDMLAAAGGAAPTGSENIVVVGTRNGQPYRTEVDLPSVFGPGRRANDVLLQNGDVIWVERAPLVYMYGEVQRPGTIRLERDMTVMQALAAGGGVTNRGTEKGMRVHRREPDGRMNIFEPKMTDPLKPNDVVYVRESVF